MREDSFDRWTELVGREIVVPGSTSNLGAGFDTLGLALRLYVRARITAIERGPEELACEFSGQTLVGENRVERAFRLLAERHQREAPRVRVEIHCGVPMRSGLGSSAAAAVAGFRLFEAFHGPRPLEELLGAAAALDGHADNAAASLLGGLTGCCETGPGRFTAWSRRWPETLRLIVATPRAEVDTPTARRVLPAEIPREDAVFNLQRIAWLMHALDAQDFAALAEAFRDRWHQPYRAPLVPAWERLSTLRHPDLLAVFISGSGPSVVGLAARNLDDVSRAMRAEYEAAGVEADIRIVAVHQQEHRS